MRSGVQEELVRWWILAGVASGPLFFWLILALAWRPNPALMIGFLITLLGGVVLISILVIPLLKRMWQHAGVVALVLVAYLFVAWGLLRSSLEMHEWVKWTLHSRTLEAAVMTQPLAAQERLRHILMEDAGGMGVHNEVYLVFSPDNALGSYSPDHLSGLPCEVAGIHRLKDQWYMVRFYSNDRWERCLTK